MKALLSSLAFQLFIYLSEYNTPEEYWDAVASRYGIVTGKDAERFVHAMRNPKPVSKEKIEEMKKNYELIMERAKL